MRPTRALVGGLVDMLFAVLVGVSWLSASTMPDYGCSEKTHTEVDRHGKAGRICVWEGKMLLGKVKLGER